VPLDPERSLLGEDSRDEPNAFVEYYRPVVELNQLEGKASDAGIELPTDSRFYSRMRAARRPAGKYIHNERITDEAYRLDEDPGEAENVLGTDDPVIEDLERALGRFESDREAWSAVEDDAVLSGMGDDAKQRLEDLGYVE